MPARADTIRAQYSIAILGETMPRILTAFLLGACSVLAGHSVLFRSAAALLEELHRQTPEGRTHKLRAYANVGLLCID